MKKRISVENNWERYEYYIDEDKINPKYIKEVEINGKMYHVHLRESTGHYSEMGFSESVERTELWIFVDDFFPVNITEAMENSEDFVVYFVKN